MTIKYMQAVWESDVPSPERFTLLALADQADDYGYCWPSTAHLVRKCRSSERTVQRHVETLRSMGVLRVDHDRPAHPRERGTNERQRTNGYTIDLAALATYRHPAPGGVKSTGVSDRHPYPRQSDTPTPVNLTPEPTEEPTEEPKPSGGTRCARPGEQADLGLDVEPTPTERKAREQDGAQAVVAAYVETYQTAHGQRPIGRDIGKIGRDARAMLRDGESLPELIAGARTMGRDGRWNDLVRQVALDRRSTSQGAPTRQGPSHAPRAESLDLTDEERRWRAYPDAEPGREPPADTATHRRMAESAGMTLAEFVEQHNRKQAACREDRWDDAEAITTEFRARQAAHRERQTG